VKVEDPMKSMSKGLILANSRTISGLNAGYGSVRVLDDVSLRVGAGETVVLLGTNGNGKSTLMKCVMGMVPPVAGSISGSLWCPKAAVLSKADGRGEPAAGCLPAGGACGDRAQPRGAYDTFPALRERRRQLAGSPSGGEQQMLALARALMSAPKMLLIDEPSVGLAPVLVKRTIEKIGSSRNAIS
jgi:branched-chain amino acid transport system ATP-binding protein